MRRWLALVVGIAVLCLALVAAVALLPQIWTEAIVAWLPGLEEMGAHRHQTFGEIQEEISIQSVRQMESWRWPEEGYTEAGDKSTGTTGWPLRRLCICVGTPLPPS